MPETVVSDLVELITDKQLADPTKLEAYIGLEHIPERAIRIEKAGDTEGIRGICVRFLEGDILFGKLRPNLRKSVRAPVEGLGSTEILVLRPKPGVDPAFAGHVLRSETVFSVAEKMTEGTRMPRTSWKILSGIAIFAPEDITAQKLVAGILDAIDDAIIETDALIKKLELVRVGLVEAIIPPRGVSSKLGALKRNDAPFVRTGPFGTTLRGIEWQDGGIPVIPISALSSSGIDEGSLDYVSPQDAKKLSSFAVSQGQILFSRVADVGRCAVIQENQGGWIMSSNLMCMTLDNDLVRPEYVKIILSSHRGVRRLIASRVNAGGRDVMNSTILASIEIPLLERSDQDRVVEQVHAIDAVIDSEQLQRNKLAQLRDGIRDDLLTGRKPVMAIREAAE